MRGIWEDPSYIAAKAQLCQSEGLSDAQCDEITRVVTWSLSTDLLSWEDSGDDTYACAIREGKDHPELVVIAKVDLQNESATLLWIGPVE